MDRKGRYPGTEAHKGKIRVYFRWNGINVREPIGVADTPANRVAAAKLVAQIKERIRLGTFRYSDYFPNSARAEVAAIVEPKVAPSFAEYAARYFEIKASTLAPSTARSYRYGLATWIHQPDNTGGALGERPIDSILHSELAAIVGRYPWRSVMRRNNMLAVLRGPFDLAERDGVLGRNPCDGIMNGTPQREDPDPLSLPEVERVLAWFGERSPEWADYWRFAIYTGLRPSEQIALKWVDVDWERRVFRVKWAKVKGVERKKTKTGRERDVELNDWAYRALRNQEARSRLKGEKVWLNPHTGKPFADECAQWRIWQTMLRAGVIRERTPYHTRHTCATILLMSGARPAWAAGQMGHSLQMFFTVYARWIGDASDNVEIAKGNAFLD